MRRKMSNDVTLSTIVSFFGKGVPSFFARKMMRARAVRKRRKLAACVSSSQSRPFEERGTYLDRETGKKDVVGGFGTDRWSPPVCDRALRDSNQSGSSDLGDGADGVDRYKHCWAE